MDMFKLIFGVTFKEFKRQLNYSVNGEIVDEFLMEGNLFIDREYNCTIIVILAVNKDSDIVEYKFVGSDGNSKGNEYVHKISIDKLLKNYVLWRKVDKLSKHSNETGNK